MPEVASLELCKRLSVLCPDAKTEYVYVKELPYPVDRNEALLKELTVICPAWQIHELLALIQQDGNWCIDVYPLNIGIRRPNDRSDYCAIDVRLVDALIKLAIWRKENE